jgi:hypothetical protein
LTVVGLSWLLWLLRELAFDSSSSRRRLGV